jgi:DUF4097 and DUF4098 domain-containing protein YvlB
MSRFCGAANHGCSRLSGGVRLAAGVVIAAAVCQAAVEHKGTIQRTFPLSSNVERKLSIDNVTGDITVTADDGQDIRVTVHEHWRADTQVELDEARREAKLEMAQMANVVKIWLDDPWRNGNRNRRRDYHVRFDFEVQVPRNILVDVGTVNGGKVRVTGVRGGARGRNVNGSVELLDVAGPVTATTVNGTVRTTFAENPRETSSFKTVNGEIAVEFQPNLSADLRFKTMNGDAFTDFDVAAAPLEPVSAVKQGAKYVYRTNKTSRVRVASGGPEHSFETLNGHIKITKRGK